MSNSRHHHSPDCCKPINITINIHLKENTMQTQFQITLTINPAQSQPVPVTLPAETVGVAVTNVPVGQAAGTGPFNVSVDPSSPAQIPPGLTAAVDVNGNLSISGTPTAPGTGTFWLDVNSAS